MGLKKDFLLCHLQTVFWKHLPLPQRVSYCEGAQTGLAHTLGKNREAVLECLHYDCSSSFDTPFLSLLSNSSSGFGTLMPVLVSFLLFKKNDPHFNPYLAETKINWFDPLSE